MSLKQRTPFDLATELPRIPDDGSTYDWLTQTRFDSRRAGSCFASTRTGTADGQGKSNDPDNEKDS